MTRIIHLIAGFRTTGKDTLHQDLMYGNITFIRGRLPSSDYSWIPIWLMIIIRTFILLLWFVHNLICGVFGIFFPWNTKRKTKWIVLANRTSGIRACQNQLLEITNRHQTALARELKKTVHDKINDTLRNEQKLDDDWFEKNKDKPIHYIDRFTTPRELYISIGTEMRKSDPTIWVRKCFESFPRYGDAKFRTGAEIIDITDWRFRLEKSYADFYSDIYKIFTTRIFRSAVPVPPDNVQSEHDLDGSITDLLLVPSWTDFLYAMMRWPQYARHMEIGSLVSEDR